MCLLKVRLCRKSRPGFEQPFFRLAVPMYIGSSIDDKTNIACFSSLDVARDKLCQAKKLLALGRTVDFSERAQYSVKVIIRPGQTQINGKTATGRGILFQTEISGSCAGKQLFNNKL